MSAVICILPSKTHTVELLQFAYSRGVIITHRSLARAARSRDEMEALGRTGWRRRGDGPETTDETVQAPLETLTRRVTDSPANVCFF